MSKLRDFPKSTSRSVPLPCTCRYRRPFGSFPVIPSFFKILGAVFFIFCLSTLGNPQVAEAQTTYFRVSSHTSAAVGSDVTINVSIENPQQVSECSFYLRYDPYIVRALSVQKGDLLSSSSDILVRDLTESDRIYIRWYNQNNNTLSGDGVLFRIEFEVQNAGSTDLDIENLQLNGDAANLSERNGMISTSGVHITTSAYLPGATRNSSYSTSLSVAGGTSPYTWSRTGGTLPPGLSLTSSGTISGTPTSTGDYDFTIRVTDNDGRSTNKYFYLTVYESGSTPLSITSNATLPRARKDYSYSTSLSAKGGRTPYRWSRTRGSLPPGLSLNSSGTISGTPTSTGTYTFTARVRDNNYDRQEKQFTITVTETGCLSHDEGLFRTLYITQGTMKLYITPDKMPYTIFVDNDINWVNLMVALENSSDRLRINGSNFYDGTSRTIPLSAGNNLITISISPDGYDYRHHTLSIYRLPKI